MTAGTLAGAQQPAAPLPQLATVKPIDPPATALPLENASARETRFSFMAYGDTRSGSASPNDAEAPNPEHSKVMDGMLAKVRELSSTAYPVRFVLQSGDAVLRGPEAGRWNVGFTPVIERLTRGANVPYFLTAGNHDVTSAPPGDVQRSLGLQNMLSAVSKLIPPEGSPRRLAGYPTYAVGFGNMFVIALDSQIAADTMQLAWFTDQLDKLDRARYKHVVVFFHHPIFSSGPHGGGSADPVPGTGVKVADRPEAQTVVLRDVYMPLFRKHHVRMLVTGHDHLYDHWVERYDDAGTTYRMDQLVTGGGGAPRYGYQGEPDLRAYLRANASANVKVEHLMKPGPTGVENPHHFVVVRVDGDQLSLEVIGTSETPYTPYPGGVAKLSLMDRRSSQ